MHDKFIRTILSDKTIAADYFQQYLPVTISRHLDFATLVQLTDSYLSKELKETMSDIVYECRRKDGKQVIKVSLLIEHKSYLDKHTPIQIGSYIFSALQKQIANKEPLSLVIPVLLYHGKGTWRYQTLSGLFKNIEPEWRQYVPDFAYIYNNLGDIPDKEVDAIKNKFLSASFLTLKHAFEQDWLEKHALQLLILVEDAPDNLQNQFVIYLFSRSKLKEAKVVELFESLPLDYKNKVMSTLDYLKEAGRKEGRKEGRQEGRQEEMEKGRQEKILIVKNLLSADQFTTAQIANFANVTEDFVFQVKAMM